MNVIQRYLRWGSMLSLRSKLIIGNIAIATLAMVAIGFLTVSRTANTSAYLTGRLNESERLRAEGELTDSTIRYARDLNEFFTSVENSMEILGLSTQAIFEQEETLGESSAWDARTQLTQLPTGSWDNANIEPGSIFLPRGSNITVIYRELNALKQLDTLAPRIQKSNPNLIAVYFGSQKGATYYYPNIDLAALLPADFDVEQRPWYIAASPKQNPGRDVVWSEPYLDAANNGVVVTSSLPIIDEHSVFRGVIAIDLKLADITTLISTIRYGESGYAFLIDRDGHMIAVSEAGYQDFGITAEEVASGSSLEKNLLLQVPLNVFNKDRRDQRHRKIHSLSPHRRHRLQPRARGGRVGNPEERHGSGKATGDRFTPDDLEPGRHHGGCMGCLSSGFARTWQCPYIAVGRIDQERPTHRRWQPGHQPEVDFG
jgi:PAS domain-containing protein